MKSTPQQIRSVPPESMPFLIPQRPLPFAKRAPAGKTYRVTEIVNGYPRFLYAVRPTIRFTYARSASMSFTDLELAEAYQFFIHKTIHVNVQVVLENIF